MNATPFWDRVDRSGDCWRWTGARNANGYGILTRRRLNLRSVLAHRYSWMLANGPIPAGLHVLHRCDNPPCVRPGHLFLGTDADNNADMRRKGRAVHHRGPRADVCKRGHPLTTENRAHKTDGLTTCRTCKNAGQRARYHLATHPEMRSSQHV
jgi:hypothetical protein